MKAYLARLHKDTSGQPHELVGFFVAESVDHLVQLVDRVCDFSDVEVQDIGAGGLYWGTQIAVIIPLRTDRKSPIPEPTFSEDWSNALYGKMDADWVRLTEIVE